MAKKICTWHKGDEVIGGAANGEGVFAVTVMVIYLLSARAGAGYSALP